MNQITSIRNGSVVSRLHGKETAEKLLLPVSGISGDGTDVRVNGVLAERDGVNFTALVPVENKVQTIVMETYDETGKFTHELKVFWDKASFPRYNIFIDDHIFFLTDIAKERPKSLFDHFYLKFLKRMHETYGTKFTLNLFYRNDHLKDGSFTLKDFPDCYKAEFQANSDWLHLSWHAYSEFPDRPYQNCTLEKLASDIELIRGEIVRFAGEESYTAPHVTHWSLVRPEAFPLLHKTGVKVLSGQFINPQTSLTENGPKHNLCDIGYFFNLPDCLYLNRKQLLYDFEDEIAFLHSQLICNYWKPEEITKILGRIIGNPNYNDIITLESHEQYSFPYYFNYLPDHLERIETAIRTATEAGYKPVFFGEGFLGNTAWND